MPRTRPHSLLIASLLAILLGRSALGTEGLVFVEDFESGGLDEQRWIVKGNRDCRIATVSAPVRAQERSGSFATAPGGRCEAVPWIAPRYWWRLWYEPFDEDRWYGFSVYLPEDHAAHPQNEVIAQWHGAKDKFLGEFGARGPPLALRIRDGTWYISFGYDAKLVSDGDYLASRVLWSGPYEVGAWTDWVFHVRWSHDEDGLTEVWKNGVKVVERRGPNAYNDFRGVYLKVGIYHPGVPRTVYLDEIRIGDENASYDLVAPRGDRL